MDYLLFNLPDNQRKLLLFAPIITDDTVTAKAFKVMSDIQKNTILHATTLVDKTPGWHEYAIDSSVQILVPESMIFPEANTPGLMAGICWQPIVFERQK